MARKKKDKPSAFEEDAVFSAFEKDLSLPPDMALSEFPPVQFGSHDKDFYRERQQSVSVELQPPVSQDKKHFEGHRKRLRERFLARSGDDMADYEILELLLYRIQPRKDTKPLAKALLAHFGSFAEVCLADIQRIKKVSGCGEAIAADLKLIGVAAVRMLRSEFPKRNIFTSWEKLIAYCRMQMAYEEQEQFRVLLLDKKNGLILDKVMQTGTVDKTPVYPRDIVKLALDFGASSLVLVHNHPSGDPTPSRQDIAMTYTIQTITRSMNIKLHDHLIVGRNGYASMKDLKFIT